jgi:hypothetical protein
MKRKPSTRLRWWLDDLRGGQDTKIVVGLVVLAVLVTGGFLAARAVADATSAAPTRSSVHLVTMRRTARVRTVAGEAHTVMQTQTIRTPNGVRVVRSPVTRYRVVYRKKVVRSHGRTRTVLHPVTNTRTSTNTQLVTVTRQLTRTQVLTATKPVTVVSTQTETQTVPLTITVTLSVP